MNWPLADIQHPTGPRSGSPSRSFLAEPAIAALVADLTSVPGDAVWVKHAAHGDGVFDSVLADGSGGEAGVIARLELPGETGRYGRGGRHLRQAAGYFIAASDGAAAPDAAARMITHVLRYALSADA